MTSVGDDDCTHAIAMRAQKRRGHRARGFAGGADVERDPGRERNRRERARQQRTAMARLELRVEHGAKVESMTRAERWLGRAGQVRGRGAGQGEKPVARWNFRSNWLIT